MENVQVKLKELRKIKNLTQVEISSKLGMAQQTWQKLESGKVPDMRVSTLAHICETMNVSADWLLNLMEVNSRSAVVHFYDQIIDLICEWGTEGYVTDSLVDVMISEVNDIYESIAD